jgi:hypothetical protein
MKKILASLILLLVFYHTNAQNAYLQQVQYRGAFAAAPASPWTAGWSNFDPQNTIYPAANVVIDATAGDTIKTNTTWTSNNVYLLKGVVYVKDNVTLTIEPGTIIRGSELVANSSIVVTRGSKIVAEGTASRPIVFTSNKQPGARARGNWGYKIIKTVTPMAPAPTEVRVTRTPTMAPNSTGNAQCRARVASSMASSGSD